jgi:transposase
LAGVSDPRELSREELLAALAERDAVIAALLAEIEQLKRRVGMDSSNSSMPPGSDGPEARAKRAEKPRKRSPRRRGGQPGHEGHALAWRSDPDQVTVVSPGQCAGCGHDLAGLEGRWPSGCRSVTPRRCGCR